MFALILLTHSLTQYLGNKEHSCAKGPSRGSGSHYSGDIILLQSKDLTNPTFELLENKVLSES